MSPWRWWTRSLRSAASWAQVVFLLATLGSLYVLATVFAPRRAPRWGRRFSQLGLRVLGVRLTVRDEGGREEGRPRVYVANHVNLLDPFLFTAAIPEPVRAVEVARHFSWAGWGTIARRAGLIPIDYATAGGVVDALTRARRVLRAGTSLVFLPEGTRTTDGRMGPFRLGPFLLAQKAGAEVVPLVQSGGFAVNNKLSWHVDPGPVTLVLLAPERHETLAEAAPEEVAARVRRRMEDALAALETPPG